MKNLVGKYGVVGAGFISQNPYLYLLGIVLIACFVIRPIISLISPKWGMMVGFVQFIAALFWLGTVVSKFL